MNVETRTEAAQFPEKEYINEISLAVYLIRIRIRIFIYPQPLHGKMFIHA